MAELKTEKCSRCKILRKPSDFLFNEKIYKTCGVCRENNKKYNDKYRQKTHTPRPKNTEKYDVKMAKMKIENPLQYKFHTMIQGAVHSDQYNGKYDAVNLVNLEYLNKLYQIQDGLCIYCKCLMELDFTQNPKKISLQRINNEYGHIKINCVFCCLNCNTSRQENKYDETHYKDILEKMES